MRVWGTSGAYWWEAETEGSPLVSSMAESGRKTTPKAAREACESAGLRLLGEAWRARQARFGL